MKKLLILLVALIFGISAPAYAAKAVLSDSELNDIHAGDWVVLDGENNHEVIDVYAVNNTLDLEDVSQKEIQAVSNANAVDAAVDVSTNVARVTGDTPTNNVGVNQSNDANITYHRPSETESFNKLETFSLQDNWEKDFTVQAAEDLAINASSSEAKAASASYAAGKVLTIDENCNIAASLAASSENEGKSYEDESALAASLAVVKTFDLDLNETESASAACSANEAKAFGLSKTKTTMVAKSEGECIGINKSKEITHESKKACGANNHISLEDDSQTLIKAVSNLNAVASGVAVQSNVASNVGVSGTITQSNVATVVAGL
ncbi:MAG: hypothetical protein WC732_03990 [Candidatus Omnitrophota bacterium]